MIERYKRLTRSNQTIIWILILVAVIWPLGLMRTPDTELRSLLSGIAFGGSTIALLYWGEKK